MKNFQYNSSHAGNESLKFCIATRKSLFAKVDKSLPIEKRVIKIAEIYAMDYNDLLKAAKTK
jgi:hypothetical protein